ncbi:hypothetical protein J2S03_001594 [Alicyclobacillus cycloheptanicus]|uniref:Uncharacterized protein n=1 Tax=Alicyclobacillus cycloheptanicus TaxID=1457 RepID=A0ABT9XHG4_9BACL|nr:hypothetical protein [Alicyclobacillus cycloheptanicus]
MEGSAPHGAVSQAEKGLRGGILSLNACQEAYVLCGVVT